MNKQLISELDCSPAILSVLRAVTHAKAQQHPGYPLFAQEQAQALANFHSKCALVRERERDATLRHKAYRQINLMTEDLILNSADHYFGPAYIAQWC